MKRTGNMALVLLAGVLFPVLIWVGLFVAVRQPLVRMMRRVGWAALGLLAGVLFPLLIWVGAGAALSRWLSERAPQRRRARTVGEILAAAGLTIQWAVPSGEFSGAAVFVEQPMAEIRELLARAGLPQGNAARQ